MSDDFDAYHKWLGIPPSEQPPNHYRLLGIQLFESDREVIRNAADQRMTYLRSFGGGPHSALSQQFLNEVSTAKLCLLSLDKKHTYDIELTSSKQQHQSGRSDTDIELSLNVPSRSSRNLPMPTAGKGANSRVLSRQRERTRRRRFLGHRLTCGLLLFGMGVIGGLVVGRNTSADNGSSSTVDVEVTQLRARIVRMDKDLSELRNKTIDLRSVVDLSNSTEEWTQEWSVLNTRGDAEWVPKDVVPNPKAGRRGVLMVHPVSEHVPASIGRVVMLDGPSPLLKLGVSGHRYGDWRLLVKINGQTLGKDQVISGAQGWQDIPYALKEYANQTVFIEVEAHANGWYWEHVLIDYISIDGIGTHTTPDSDSQDSAQIESNPTPSEASWNGATGTETDQYDNGDHLRPQHPIALRALPMQSNQERTASLAAGDRSIETSGTDTLLSGMDAPGSERIWNSMANRMDDAPGSEAPA